MRQAVLMELPSSHDRLLPHLTVPLFTEAGCRGHCACNPNISTLAGTRRALIALYVPLSLIPPTSPPQTPPCPEPMAHTATTWVSGRAAVLFSPMHNSMDKCTAPVKS